jgi:hypothetical protein
MFKDGDEVVCTFGEGKKGTFTGSIYTVSNVHGSWMKLKHFNSPFHVSCFKKVNHMTIEINPKAKSKKADTKSQANIFYVRRVGTVTEKVVHKTFEDARNEANRLAELTPNHEVQVLAVAYTVKKVPVYTTESQEYGV